MRAARFYRLFAHDTKLPYSDKNLSGFFQCHKSRIERNCFVAFSKQTIFECKPKLVSYCLDKKEKISSNNINVEIEEMAIEQVNYTRFFG